MRQTAAAGLGWRRWLVGLGCALLCATVCAEELVPLVGSPPAGRYAPDLAVTPQNFDVVRGADGLVYVANVDGVLVFDGEGWELVPLPNRDVVRSLAVADDGRILVGGYNAFGYLQRNAAGSIQYVELTPQFANWIGTREFADIWDIEPAPDGVYFRAVRDVFFWRPDGPPAAWHHAGRFGALQVDRRNGRVLLQFRGEGFRERRGDAWVLLPGSRSARTLVGKLVPLPDGGWLLGEAVDPGWRRLTAAGTIETLDMPADLLPEAHADPVDLLGDGSLAFVGRDGVVQIVDPQRTTRRAFQLESGFLSSIHVQPGAFLVSSDQAVYYIEWPSSWTVLGAEHGATGMLTALRSWQGRDYLLGSAGVQRIEPRAGRMPQFVAQPWPVDAYDDLLGLDDRQALLAGSHQLAWIRDGVLSTLGDGPVYPRKLMRAQHWPGRIWVGTENGLRYVDPVDGTLQLSAATELGVDARVNSLVERGPRELWFGTERHGLWRATLTASGHFDQLARLDLQPESGLQLGRIAEARLISWVDGQLLVSTRAGFFRFDPDGGRFVRDTLDGLEALRVPEQALYPVLAPDGTRWAYGLGGLYRQRPGEAWMQSPVHALRRGALIEHRFDADGRIQFVDTQALLLHDASGAASAAATSVQVLLRNVEHIAANGTVHALPLAPPDPPEFIQGDFGIRFRFALPELAASRQVRYRGRLVGYETEFSPWSAARGYTYSRLAPGAYQLEVEARDSSGRVTAIAPWPMRIVPPWHRRGWVLGIAFGVAAALVLLALRWQVQRRLRRLDAERTRLEQTVAERTRDLASANARLQQMAHLDGLTGIANRRRLDEELTRTWTQARLDNSPIALLAIDVDHFKRFNDAYGHLAGDELLRRLAVVLAGVLRPEGELLARYGGEEFIVLLSGVGQETALARATALREAVSRAALGVTVSIGVAEARPRAPDADPTTLIAAADTALYAAKSAGRDCVVVAASGGSASRP